METVVFHAGDARPDVQRAEYLSTLNIIALLLRGFVTVTPMAITNTRALYLCTWCVHTPGAYIRMINNTW